MPLEVSDEPQMVEIASLVLDPALQLRAVERLDKVEEYADNLNRMPPAQAVLADDGKAYVWDGFHTLKAALEKGRVNYPVVLTAGTWDDAFLLACGANAAHGIDRTPEDKQRAVRAMLNHPTYGQWSARSIAKACSVSDTFVLGVKSAWEQEREAAHKAQAAGRNGKPAREKPKKVIGRDGKPQAAKKRKKPTGKVRFDNKKRFTLPFGAAYRLPDDLYRAFGKVGPGGGISADPAHRAMRDHLKRFEEVFKETYKAFSKEPAPEE